MRLFSHGLAGLLALAAGYTLTSVRVPGLALQVVALGTPPYSAPPPPLAPEPGIRGSTPATANPSAAVGAIVPAMPALEPAPAVATPSPVATPAPTSATAPIATPPAGGPATTAVAAPAASAAPRALPETVPVPAPASAAAPAPVAATPTPAPLSPPPPVAPAPPPPPAPPRAVARAEGTGAPGLQIALRGDESRGSDLRYRWIQTRGPAVLMDNPSSPVARFTVPAGVGPLGFLLVVSGPNGSDTAELSIPIEGLPRAPENTALKADAGDDQLGLVGRQVTLNGVRSEPKGRIGYRWVQTAGPTVRFKLEDGYIYSFVPTVPGIYRFALVIATGNEISTPDEVSVTVGSGARTSATPGTAASASSPVEGLVPSQEVARAGLASIRGGAELGDALARVFEETGDRMDLYQAYSDTFTEMSRRLDTVLPRDPTQRNLWIERLFNPLTGRLVDIMRAEGLDLRTAEGQSAPLSAAQKAALAEQFRLMAEGFRSLSRPR